MIRARCVLDEDVHIVSKRHIHMPSPSSAALDHSHLDVLLDLNPPSRASVVSGKVLMPQRRTSSGRGRKTSHANTDTNSDGSSRRAADVVLIRRSRSRSRDRAANPNLNHQAHPLPGTFGTADREVLRALPHTPTVTQPEARAANPKEMQQTTEQRAKETLRTLLQAKANQESQKELLKKKRDHVKQLSKTWTEKHAMEMQRREMEKLNEALIMIDSDLNHSVVTQMLGNLATSDNSHRPSPRSRSRNDRSPCKENKQPRITTSNSKLEARSIVSPCKENKQPRITTSNSKLEARSIGLKGCVPKLSWRSLKNERPDLIHQYREHVKRTCENERDEDFELRPKPTNPSHTHTYSDDECQAADETNFNPTPLLDNESKSNKAVTSKRRTRQQMEEEHNSHTDVHGEADAKAMDVAQKRAKAALKRIQQQKEAKLKNDRDKRKRLQEVEMQTLHAKKGSRRSSSSDTRATTTGAHTHTEASKEPRERTRARIRKSSESRLQMPLTWSVEQQYRDFFESSPEADSFIPVSSQMSAAMRPRPELEYLLSSPDPFPTPTRVSNSNHTRNSHGTLTGLPQSEPLPSSKIQNRRHDRTQHPSKTLPSTSSIQRSAIVPSTRGRSARRHTATYPHTHAHKSKQAHARSQSLCRPIHANQRSRSVRKRATSAPSASLRRRQSNPYPSPNPVPGRRRRRHLSNSMTRTAPEGDLTRVEQQRILGIDAVNELNISVTKSFQDLRETLISYMRTMQTNLELHLERQPQAVSGSAFPDPQAHGHPLPHKSESPDLPSMSEVVRASPVQERYVTATVTDSADNQRPNLTLTQELPSLNERTHTQELDERITADRVRASEKLEDSALGYWNSLLLRSPGRGIVHIDGQVEEDLNKASEHRDMMNDLQEATRTNPHPSITASILEELGLELGLGSELRESEVELGLESEETTYAREQPRLMQEGVLGTYVCSVNLPQLRTDENLEGGLIRQEIVEELEQSKRKVSGAEAVKDEQPAYSKLLEFEPKDDGSVDSLDAVFPDEQISRRMSDEESAQSYAEEIDFKICHEIAEQDSALSYEVGLNFQPPDDDSADRRAYLSMFEHKLADDVSMQSYEDRDFKHGDYDTADSSESASMKEMWETLPDDKHADSYAEWLYSEKKWCKDSNQESVKSYVDIFDSELQAAAKVHVYEAKDKAKVEFDDKAKFDSMDQISKSGEGSVSSYLNELETEAGVCDAKLNGECADQPILQDGMALTDERVFKELQQHGSHREEVEGMQDFTLREVVADITSPMHVSLPEENAQRRLEEVTTAMLQDKFDKSAEDTHYQSFGEAADETSYTQQRREEVIELQPDEQFDQSEHSENDELLLYEEPSVYEFEGEDEEGIQNSVPVSFTYLHTDHLSFGETQDDDHVQIADVTELSERFDERVEYENDDLVEGGMLDLVPTEAVADSTSLVHKRNDISPPEQDQEDYAPSEARINSTYLRTHILTYRSEAYEQHTPYEIGEGAEVYPKSDQDEKTMRHITTGQSLSAYPRAQTLTNLSSNEAEVYEQHKADEVTDSKPNEQNDKDDQHIQSVERNDEVQSKEFQDSISVEEMTDYMPLLADVSTYASSNQEENDFQGHQMIDQVAAKLGDSYDQLQGGECKYDAVVRDEMGEDVKDVVFQQQHHMESQTHIAPHPEHTEADLGVEYDAPEYPPFVDHEAKTFEEDNDFIDYEEQEEWVEECVTNNPNYERVVESQQSLVQSGAALELRDSDPHPESTAIGLERPLIQHIHVELGPEPLQTERQMHVVEVVEDPDEVHKEDTGSEEYVQDFENDDFEQPALESPSQSNDLIPGEAAQVANLERLAEDLDPSYPEFTVHAVDTTVVDTTPRNAEQDTDTDPVVESVIVGPLPQSESIEEEYNLQFNGSFNVDKFEEETLPAETRAPSSSLALALDSSSEDEIETKQRVDHLSSHASQEVLGQPFTFCTDNNELEEVHDIQVEQSVEYLEGSLTAENWDLMGHIAEQATAQDVATRPEAPSDETPSSSTNDDLFKSMDCPLSPPRPRGSVQVDQSFEYGEGSISTTDRDTTASPLHASVNVEPVLTTLPGDKQPSPIDANEIYLFEHSIDLPLSPSRPIGSVQVKQSFKNSEGSISTADRDLTAARLQVSADVEIDQSVEYGDGSISGTSWDVVAPRLPAGAYTGLPGAITEQKQTEDHGEVSFTSVEYVEGSINASEWDVTAPVTQTHKEEIKSALRGIVSYGPRTSLQQRREERDAILSLLEGHDGDLGPLFDQLSYGLLQSLSAVPLEHLQGIKERSETKEEPSDDAGYEPLGGKSYMPTINTTHGIEVTEHEGGYVDSPYMPSGSKLYDEEAEEVKTSSSLPPIRGQTIMDDEIDDMYEFSPADHLRQEVPQQTVHTHREGCECLCNAHQRSLQWISAEMLFIDAMLESLPDQDLMLLLTSPNPIICPEAEGELFEVVLGVHIQEIRENTDLSHVSEDDIIMHAIASWDHVFEILSSIHGDRHLRLDLPRPASRFPRTNRASSISNGTDLKAEIIRRAAIKAEQEEKQLMLCAQKTPEKECTCLCTYEATREWRHEEFYEELCDVEDEMIRLIADGMLVEILRSVVTDL